MRLIDNFMPLIAYVARLRDDAAATNADYQQVRGEIQRLLSQSEGSVKRGEASGADYDLARFMVCAWTDEVLLGSDWSGKGAWQREQLQRLYYNTVAGGVEAFEKLNQLELHQKEVREVYYVCLALGFRGRFINPGDDFLLEKLRASNLKLLTRVSPSHESQLFPEAFPAPAPEPKKRTCPSSVGFWVGIVAPLLLFVVLHLVFRFSLHSVADKLF